MCDKFDLAGFNRRKVLKLALGGALVSGLSLSSGLVSAADTATPLSPREALEKLKEGNAKYISEPELCSLDLAESRKNASRSQAPWATILSCSDSRVPPELIFGGRGIGELFVARNAGNLANTATIGTLEYGSAVLGAPLIVVLAHTNCGAVQAACDVVTDNATFPGSIGRMIEPIIPAAIAERDTDGSFVDNTARESARRTAAALGSTSAILTERIAAGSLKIIPAIYDLRSGEVSYQN